MKGGNPKLKIYTEEEMNTIVNNAAKSREYSIVPIIDSYRIDLPNGSIPRPSLNESDIDNEYYMQPRNPDRIAPFIKIIITRVEGTDPLNQKIYYKEEYESDDEDKTTFFNETYKYIDSILIHKLYKIIYHIGK